MENVELRGVANTLTHAGQVRIRQRTCIIQIKPTVVRSMSKTTSRKEERAPADPFLIKRTVSAPTSERRENLSKSAQHYRDYDDGKQRKPHARGISTVEGASKFILSNSPQTSYSLETSVTARKSVKDLNVYRSKSRPSEQTSNGGSRGASRDTAIGNTDELPMECDRCRRGLHQLASRSLGDKDSFETILDHCNRLEAFVCDLVSKAPELCSRQEFGAKVWNCSHYFVIEAMRKQVQEPLLCVPAIKEQLFAFLNHSIQFYSHLIKSTEASCGFQVSQLVTGKAELSTKSSSSRRRVMTGASLCQWCYVYLGDLSRYREQLAPKPDWSKPREYYFNAQQLAPKDGRPYNQLAVIAISAQRRLDAIYFYMRSLAAKNQWLSAHDSLVGIFEDTCRKAKKVEEEEKARRSRANKKQKSGSKAPSTRHHISAGKGAIRRKETWVMPGTEEWSEMRSLRHSVDRGGPPVVEQQCGSAGESVTIADQCEQVVTSELNRKLTSAFLVAHGKLFTKIGIESFSSSMKRFVTLWRCALRTQVVLNSSQTLKMVIINIFNIHHVAQNSDSEAGKKLYCGMAFSLSLELCTAIFQSYLEQLEPNEENMAVNAQAPPAEGPQLTRETFSSQECQRSDQDSSSSLGASSPSVCKLDSAAFLLPAVKLWFDWLEHQQDFWTSFLPGVDSKTLSNYWDAVFRFLNKCFVLHRSELHSVSFGPKPPLFWEDKVTAGFMPLKGSISTEETFSIADAMQLPPQQHHAQCLLRLSVVMKVCKDLCVGLGGVLGISYDASKEQFICIPVIEEEEEGPKRIEGTVDQELEEDLKAEEDLQLPEASDENLADDEVKELPHIAEEQKIEGGTSDGEDLAIDQLKKERDKLSKEVEFHHHAIESVQTLISEAINKASEEVYIEPKYLVPDTNCFISSLPAIQALVKSQLFVVAVPLIVMAELDGLSKGSSDLESSTTSAKISSAKQAMEFAKTEILNKSSHIKLLTTQGSLLSSLSLKEEVGEEATNDNLILRSSLYLHTKMDKGTKHTRGGDFYSVVLLTDDRNLRVKAHANSLPVKEMSAFMLMAKLAQ